METVYNGNYDFKGLWDMPSRCGLKIIKASLHTVIIVSELYKENPGTTISFYEEEYFRVFFTINDGILEKPEYKKISEEDLSKLLQ